MRLWRIILIITITTLYQRPTPTLSQSTRDFTCRWANLTAMPFCGSFVDYQIASDLNEGLQDGYAYDRNQQTCEYFAYQPFACSEFLPRCVNATATKPASEILICRDYCLGALDNAECNEFFDEASIRGECSHDVYSSTEPCLGEDQIGMPKKLDKSLYWKLGLGLGLGVLAIIMIVVVWRRSKRENATEAQLAKHDARKAKKREQARAAQQEKEKKQAAAASLSKKKKKDRQNGRAYEGAEGVPNGGVGDGEGNLELHDVELGSVSPPRRPASASGPSVSPPRGISSSSRPNSPPGHSHPRSTIAEAQPPMSKKQQRAVKKETIKVQRPLLDGEGEGEGAHALADSPLDEQVSSPLDRPVQLHMLASPTGDDAWKSGLPTRVAPPQ